MIPRTLQGRLALTFGIATLAVAAVLGRRRVRAVPHRAAERARRRPLARGSTTSPRSSRRPTPPPSTPRVAPVLPETESFAQVLRPDGAVLTASPRALLAAPGALAVGAAPGRARDRDARPVDPTRGATRPACAPVPPGSASERVVIVVGHRPRAERAGRAAARPRPRARPAAARDPRRRGRLVPRRRGARAGAVDGRRGRRARGARAGPAPVDPGRRRGARRARPSAQRPARPDRVGDGPRARVPRRREPRAAHADRDRAGRGRAGAHGRGRRRRDTRDSEVARALDSTLEEVERLDRLAANLLVLARTRAGPTRRSAAGRPRRGRAPRDDQRGPGPPGRRGRARDRRRRCDVDEPTRRSSRSATRPRWSGPIGNLVDNALRHARTRVDVDVRRSEDGSRSSRSSTTGPASRRRCCRRCSTASPGPVPAPGRRRRARARARDRRRHRDGARRARRRRRTAPVGAVVADRGPGAGAGAGTGMIAVVTSSSSHHRSRMMGVPVRVHRRPVRGSDPPPDPTRPSLRPACGVVPSLASRCAMRQDVGSMHSFSATILVVT